jgi:hypothetical protein
LDYLTTHTSLSPIRRGFAPGFVNYKKGCTRLAAASDKVYQLLAHGRWFSLGTPASSTTKTGCHDIAEILLNVALKHQQQKIQSTKDYKCGICSFCVELRSKSKEYWALNGNHLSNWSNLSICELLFQEANYVLLCCSCAK